MIERTRLQIQAVERSLLCRQGGWADPEGQVEKLSLTWGGASRGARASVSEASWMPPFRSVQACLTGMRRQGRPMQDMLQRLSLGWPGVPPEDLGEVTQAGEVWVSLLKLLPGEQTPNNCGRRHNK